jgi:hypothetical protein
MRHTLTSVVLLVLLFPSFALGEMMDDLVLRDGLYYKKFTTVPFSGKITGNTQGTFRNTKMNGQGTLISPDGSSYVGEWKNGCRHGQGTSIPYFKRVQGR